MEINLKTNLNITLNQDEIGNLMEELDWLAKTYDFQVETLLDIREEILKEKLLKEMNKWQK